MLDTFFHIHVPIYGVKKLFGWDNEIGVGLLKRKIDRLAKDDRTIRVRIGDDIQEYTIKVRKVKEFPIHRSKKILIRGQEEIKSPVITYVVKKSALNPCRTKTKEEIEKELFIKYHL